MVLVGGKGGKAPLKLIGLMGQRPQFAHGRQGFDHR